MTFYTDNSKPILWICYCFVSRYGHMFGFIYIYMKISVKGTAHVGVCVCVEFKWLGVQCLFVDFFSNR